LARVYVTMTKMKSHLIGLHARPWFRDAAIDLSSVPISSTIAQREAGRQAGERQLRKPVADAELGREARQRSGRARHAVGAIR
jgi:hypothetical protein